MDLTALNKIDWNAKPWKTVRHGIERKTFGSDQVTLALHRLHPGHEVLPHTHPNEQIVYILDGEVDFHIGDDVVPLRGGGLVVVPPDVRHWVEVTGDRPAINLDIFTPARPEYLVD